MNTLNTQNEVVSDEIVYIFAHYITTHRLIESYKKPPHLLEHLVGQIINALASNHKLLRDELADCDC